MKKCLSHSVIWGFLVTGLYAQHCPFDGFSAIIIRLNTPINDSTPEFFLAEKTGKTALPCKFVERFEKEAFQSENEVMTTLANDPNTVRSKFLQQWMKKDFNFLKGNMVVFLTTPEKDCMVADGNNYINIERVFLITYQYRDIEYEIPVTPEKIYNMCSIYGTWKRMTPIKIKIPANPLPKLD